MKVSAKRAMVVRLQLRLRTILGITALIALFFGWLAWMQGRARTQRDVVSWVEKCGGTVDYDFEFEDSIRQTPSFLRKPLERFLGTDFCSCVVAVRFLEPATLCDISPLENLKQLKRLELTEATVNDFSTLTKLTDLESLHLGETNIVDLSAVTDLTKLQSLVLTGTDVADLSPIRDLTSLTVLGLDKTLVSDLASLSRLTNLKRLFLKGTRVNDISPLAKMVKLEYLHLRNTKLRDLSPVQAMLKLETLHLGGTVVSDLQPIRELAALKRLGLEDNHRIVDLEVLMELPNLKMLWLGKTGVEVEDVELLRESNPALHIFSDF